MSSPSRQSEIGAPLAPVSQRDSNHDHHHHLDTSSHGHDMVSATTVTASPAPTPAPSAAATAGPDRMVLLDPLLPSQSNKDVAAAVVDQAKAHAVPESQQAPAHHQHQNLPIQSHTSTQAPTLTPPSAQAGVSSSSTHTPPSQPPSASHPPPLSAATPLDGTTTPAQSGTFVEAADIKSRAGRPVPAAAANLGSNPNPSQRPAAAPSLLSQALATARGIPPKDSTTDKQRRTTIQPPSTSQQSARDGSSINPDNTAAITADQSSKNTNNEKPTQHGERAKSITSRDKNKETKSAMAASAAPSVAAPFTGRDAMPGTASFSDQTIAHIRESLMEHRDFLDRTRGRTSSSLDIDRKTFELPSDHPFSYSTSPDDLTSATSAYYFDRTTTSPSKPRDGVADPRQQNRHYGAEPRHLNGSEKTEKIWSIGAGEGSEEDGLVEKSVAEAMAGVEHNNRSRKASYSLRFFKEALPDEDKPRRKDTKAARDKLTPTTEETEQAVLDSSSVSDVAVDDEPLTPLQQPTRADQKTPTETPHKPETTDYFTTEDDDVAGDETPVVRASDDTQTDSNSVPPLDVGPVPESVGALQQQPSLSTPKGRDSCDSGDGDADESGEEKISSAVFVPHQELSDDPRDEVESPDPEHPQRPRAPSHNQPHPWLVKADEPEPEIIEEEGKPYELSHRRSRENLAARRIEQEAAKPEPRQTEVDTEPKSAKSTCKAARILTAHDEHIHDHTNNNTREPLEAIELIPYKHQVGGHTTLWRFSRRAVCKQLNNRENEFYETIERYHRDLLPFLPRYIGVLNVTFQKQPRRKSVSKKDEQAAAERKKLQDAAAAEGQANGQEIDSAPATNGIGLNGATPNRVISQSLANSALQIPTVTFDDNRHILPRSLLQPTPPPEYFRRRSASISKTSPQASWTTSQRPHMDNRPNSWGATTINKQAPTSSSTFHPPTDSSAIDSPKRL
ncbi:hypothetical protein PWT90_11123 [Aphanocladium album]|nr:hypothetical protein PWT90_11123 [Aphanocladium album]